MDEEELGEVLGKLMRGQNEVVLSEVRAGMSSVSDALSKIADVMKMQERAKEEVPNQAPVPLELPALEKLGQLFNESSALTLVSELRSLNSTLEASSRRSDAASEGLSRELGDAAKLLGSAVGGIGDMSARGEISEISDAVKSLYAAMEGLSFDFSPVVGAINENTEQLAGLRLSIAELGAQLSSQMSRSKMLEFDEQGMPTGLRIV